MNRHLLPSAILALAALAGPLAAQGSLDPPDGTPTPTMRTLNELYEAIGGVTPLAPSALVELTSASAISANSSSQLSRLSQSGESIGVYTVPSGKVLVITDLEIFPEAYDSNGILTFELVQDGTTRRHFRLRADRPFACNLRTGIVIGSGATLTARNASSGGSASIRIFMQGYLTDDE